MKKILAGSTIGIGIIFITNTTYGYYLHEDARLSLFVPQLVELVGIKTNVRIVPGPEDYARDLSPEAVINYVRSTYDTGGASAQVNAMQCDIGKGFAERTDALSLTIFTNAQDGAVLYVHGSIPREDPVRKLLRLEDTYITVDTERTYILHNQLEGAHANARTSNDIIRGVSTTTWLRIHTEAQHIFEVKTATKAPRLIVFNIGVANLASYTEGEYGNILTFTLMPIIG